MGRERKGSIVVRRRRAKGREHETVLYARVTYTDDTGKHHDLSRRAENRTHARLLIKQLLRKIEQEGQSVIDAERMTFAQLADRFKKTYLIPPQYVDGRKVAGLRSYKCGLQQAQVLLEFFGTKRLQSVTFADLERFKQKRLESPTVRGTQRSIASVNRELTLLRRMFNVAVREGWMARNPFSSGKTLISQADERKRNKVLSRDEEQRLLAASTGRRSHLRPLIVAALDTGCRQGELLKLQWKDVDFENRTILIQSFNTKTMRARFVPMTSRLAAELEAMNNTNATPDALVFGVVNNVKRSWESVRQAAGLPDLRFHDLRHVAATRLVQGHLPLSQVGNLLGHSSPTTTARYVNLTDDTLKQATSILEAFHNGTETSQK